MFPIKLILAVLVLVALTVLVTAFTPDETEANEQALTHVLDLMEESQTQAGVVPGHLSEEEAEEIRRTRSEGRGLLTGLRSGSAEMGLDADGNTFWYAIPYTEAACTATGEHVQAAFVGTDEILTWTEEMYAVYTLRQSETPILVLSNLIEEAEYPWAARLSVSTDEEEYSVVAEYTDLQDGTFMVTAMAQTKKGRFKSQDITILGRTSARWLIGEDSRRGDRFLCFRNDRLEGVRCIVPEE